MDQSPVDAAVLKRVFTTSGAPLTMGDLAADGAPADEGEPAYYYVDAQVSVVDAWAIVSKYDYSSAAVMNDNGVRVVDREAVQQAAERCVTLLDKQMTLPSGGFALSVGALSMVRSLLRSSGLSLRTWTYQCQGNPTHTFTWPHPAKVLECLVNVEDPSGAHSSPPLVLLSSS